MQLVVRGVILSSGGGWGGGRGPLGRWWRKCDFRIEAPAVGDPIRQRGKLTLCVFPILSYRPWFRDKYHLYFRKWHSRQVVCQVILMHNCLDYHVMFWKWTFPTWCSENEPYSHKVRGTWIVFSSKILFLTAKAPLVLATVYSTHSVGHSFGLTHLQSLRADL